MRRSVLLVLVILTMVLAASPVLAENGPKVGDAPSAMSVFARER